jgi:hypothetical protein
LRANGGRGRIRTSVARKERQIYSLLVLATHPPVRTGKPPSRSNGASLSAERHPLARVVHAGNSLSFVYRSSPPQHRYNSKISWRRDLNPRPSDYKSDALPLSYASAAQTKGRYQKGNSIARAGHPLPVTCNLTSPSELFWTPHCIKIPGLTQPPDSRSPKTERFAF